MENNNTNFTNSRRTYNELVKNLSGKDFDYDICSHNLVEVCKELGYRKLDICRAFYQFYPDHAEKSLGSTFYPRFVDIVQYTTMTQAATELHLSPERVRQLIEKFMVRLTYKEKSIYLNRYSYDMSWKYGVETAEKLHEWVCNYKPFSGCRESVYIYWITKWLHDAKDEQDLIGRLKEALTANTFPKLRAVLAERLRIEDRLYLLEILDGGESVEEQERSYEENWLRKFRSTSPDKFETLYRSINHKPDYIVQAYNALGEGSMTCKDNTWKLFVMLIDQAMRLEQGNSPAPTTLIPLQDAYDFVYSGCSGMEAFKELYKRNKKYLLDVLCTIDMPERERMCVTLSLFFDHETDVVCGWDIGRPYMVSKLKQARIRVSDYIRENAILEYKPTGDLSYLKWMRLCLVNNKLNTVIYHTVRDKKYSIFDSILEQLHFDPELSTLLHMCEADPDNVIDKKTLQWAVEMLDEVLKLKINTY